MNAPVAVGVVVDGVEGLADVEIQANAVLMSQVQTGQIVGTKNKI